MSAGHRSDTEACDCDKCAMILEIISYMMLRMPPSDRALWPEPAPRLEMPGRD